MSNTSGTTKKQKLAPVRVFLRIRPTVEQDGPSAITYLTPKEICVKGHSKTYSFDQIFDEKTAQNKVYKTVVGSIIADVVKGYNCTVFAYGQTGTGKTYTILGGDTLNSKDEKFNKDEDTDAGIILRASKHLYDELDKIDSSVQYTVTVSFMEIYNEEIRDLLSDKEILPLRIYEDKTKCVRVKNLQEVTVLNIWDILNLLKKGCEKRQMASTLMNNRSSRSHTVFTINVSTIQTISVAGNISNIICGKLSLIDLAGSENIAKSGSKDQRAREASNINQSLLTLGRVIKALVENSSHVPYRESKLTRILQDSLGGKTKTAIIATISPGMSSLDETLNTLDYAFSARHVTNCPTINLRTSATAAAVHEEVMRLKRDLFATANEQGVYMDKENYEDMTKSLLEYKKDIFEKHETIQSLKDKLDDLLAQREEWENLRKSFEITKQAYQECQTEIQSTKGLLRKDQLLLNYYENEIVKSEEFTEQLALKQNYLHERINSLYGTSSSNKKAIERLIEVVEEDLDDTVTKVSQDSLKTSEQVEQLSLFNKNIWHMLDNVKKQLDDKTTQYTCMCDGLSSTENQTINDPLCNCSRKYMDNIGNMWKTSIERRERAKKLKQQAVETLQYVGSFGQHLQISNKTILEEVMQKRSEIKNILSEDIILEQLKESNDRVLNISNVLLEVDDQLSEDKQSLMIRSRELSKDHEELKKWEEHMLRQKESLERRYEQLLKDQEQLAKKEQLVATMRNMAHVQSWTEVSAKYVEERTKQKDRICDFSILENDLTSYSQKALQEISTISNMMCENIDIENVLQTEQAITEMENQRKQATEFVRVIEAKLTEMTKSCFEVASVVEQITRILDVEGTVQLEHLNEIVRSQMQFLCSKSNEIKSKMHQIFNSSFIPVSRTGATPVPMSREIPKRSSRGSIVRKLILDNTSTEENTSTNSST
ncbi:hypothetical protein WA026_004317 [Henosepilachna vigintioctopunctata]|uniref:Kinesin-like protein n=1 Tax=Henosepilachna vigintioctopunctata TaxID=420089 RepID=A0AAW1V695_9CUCU